MLDHCNIFAIISIFLPFFCLIILKRGHFLIRSLFSRYLYLTEFYRSEYSFSFLQLTKTGGGRRKTKGHNILLACNAWYASPTQIYDTMVWPMTFSLAFAVLAARSRMKKSIIGW